MELADTASVQVGANALANPVAVSISIASPPTASPGSPVSKVIEFTPHGLQFKIPAKLALRYDSNAPADRLRVLRLPDEHAQTWEVVGGAKFENGVATFESTSFSYYVVADGVQCTPISDPVVACSASCECCGTASCVDLTNSPNNCGACGVACGATGFCSSASACVPLASTKLCENKSLYVITGELPDLKVVNPEQTTDGVSADTMAQAIGTACGLTPTKVSQATAGILDPCTDAPLLKAGTTILLTGGGFAQRLARALDRSKLTPVLVPWDDVGKKYSFVTQTGTVLGTFVPTQLNPRHDYFVISLASDPDRGALILQVYGMGWEGTPAAAWYFNNKVLPEITAGTRTWKRYMLVEWTDNGDGVKNGSDTFTVLAQE